MFVTFKSFVKGIHNEFETTIKRVRSDNGSEFKNTRIDELCDEFGIRHYRCGTHGIPRKEERRSSLTRILPM